MADVETTFAQLVELSRERRTWIDQQPAGEPLPAGGPPPPDRQREVVVRLGAAAVPVAAAALAGDDDDAVREALLVLERLGPTAAPARDAVLAILTGPVDARRTGALTAMFSIDLDALLASPAHLDPRVIAVVDVAALAEHPPAVRALLGRVLDEGDEKVVLAALDGKGLSVTRLLSISLDNLIPIVALRRRLADNRPMVRRKAAVVLARFGSPTDAPKVIGELANAESLDVDLVARLAPYPGSEALIHVLARAGKATPELRLLIARRRMAGLTTDSAQVRDLVRAALAEALPPGGLSKGERARMSSAVLLAGWLDDPQLFDPLVKLWQRAPALDVECRLALAAFGDLGRDLLASTPAVGGERPHDAHLGDDRLIEGRIDDQHTGDLSACDLYEQAFLADPNNHEAAFMMAWIDRAFGVTIRPERLAWLHDVGVADRGLLADLAEPPRQTLRGVRRQWTPGFPHRDPKATATRAGEAGLHGLAAAFLERAGDEAGAEKHRQLERDLVARVRGSGAPRGVPTLEPARAAAHAAIGSWCWIESPEGWLLGFATYDAQSGVYLRASRVSQQPTAYELDVLLQQPSYAIRVGDHGWTPVAEEQRVQMGLPVVPPWAWRERPWLHDPALRASRLPAAPDIVSVLFVGDRTPAREWLWVRLDGVDVSCAGYTGVVIEAAAQIEVPARVSVRCPPKLSTSIWVSEVALANLRGRDCRCERCGCDVYPSKELPAAGDLTLECPACQGVMPSRPWPPTELPRAVSASATCRRCNGPIGLMARRPRDRTICRICGDLVTLEAR